VPSSGKRGSPERASWNSDGARRASPACGKVTVAPTKDKRPAGETSDAGGRNADAPRARATRVTAVNTEAG